MGLGTPWIRRGNSKGTGYGSESTAEIDAGIYKERVMGPSVVMGRVSVEHDYRDDHVRSTFVVGVVSDGAIGLTCRSSIFMHGSTY